MPNGCLRSRAKTTDCCARPSGPTPAQHADLVGLALGDEEIAVGRRADEARVRQLVRVKLDLEAARRLRPGRRRPVDHPRAVVHRSGRVRRRQIDGAEVVGRAGSLVAVVGADHRPFDRRRRQKRARRRGGCRRRGIGRCARGSGPVGHQHGRGETKQQRGQASRLRGPVRRHQIRPLFQTGRSIPARREARKSLRARTSMIDDDRRQAMLAP